MNGIVREVYKVGWLQTYETNHKFDHFKSSLISESIIAVAPQTT